MKFDSLLEAVGDEPVFETGLLLAGDVDPVAVRHQLSRWMETGRIYRLRRGLYSLAPPFRKILPHPFLVANRMAPLARWRHGPVKGLLASRIPASYSPPAF